MREMMKEVMGSSERFIIVNRKHRNSFPISREREREREIYNYKFEREREREIKLYIYYELHIKRT